MRLELTKEFVSLLQKAKLIVPKNTPMPILEYGKLFSEGENLWLAVTNLDIFLELKIGEGVIDEVCIPIEKTYQIVKTLGLKKETKNIKLLFSQKAYLEISEANIEIVQKGTKLLLNTLPSKDFPQKYDFSSENQFSISGEVFSTLIKKVMFATDTNDRNCVISGVHFFAENNTLSVVGTDGHRLSLATYLIEFAEKTSFTLYYPTACTLLKLLNKKDIKIEVSQETNLVRFSGEDWNLLSRCFDSLYPEWEYVIPESCSKEIICKTKELKICLEQIKRLLPKEKFISINFEVKEDKITIKQEEISFNRIIKCKLNGEEINFGVNLRYLLDVLNVIDNSEVYLKMTSSLEPILIWNYKEKLIEKHIIMPIRLV